MSPTIQRPEDRTIPSKTPLRFDRNELAGAFGDLGTDFPLIVGMILAARLDSTSVLVAYGLMQLLTGIVYRLPMPVQPLKAVAALVITQHVAANTVYGSGLAIGVAMLVLTLGGGIDWLARVTPKSVVRGIQLGLGLQLASLALREYVGADKAPGYALAALAFVVTLALIRNRRVPAALVVVGMGLVYAVMFKAPLMELVQTAGFRLPQFHAPTFADITTGFVLLALPQLPLSLGNSILATKQVAEDLYPDVRLSVRKIGLTYAAMNLASPFLSGIPVCHGSGGFAGHYAFGGRTGGSVVIYGAIFMGLGLFFGSGLARIVDVFPLPMLGILLLFEALALIMLVRDVAQERRDFFIAALVALCAAFLPYGYVIGMVVGAVIAYLVRRGFEVSAG
jgi:hypothetical protein